MNMNTNIDGAKAMAGLAIVLALLLSSGAATAQQQQDLPRLDGPQRWSLGH